MARIMTWLLGISFLALGLMFSFGLQQLAGQLGTTFGREGLVDGLAVYGGLHLAIGAFTIVCAIYRLYGLGALLGLLVFLGLSCVRTISMFELDTVTDTQLLLLAPEVVGVVLTAMVFSARRGDLKVLSQISA
jgi:hypothetical protein